MEHFDINIQKRYMTKKTFFALFIVNWSVIALIPSFLLLVLLIVFYQPLQGIGHDHVFVRGKILDTSNDSVKISFEKSSTFWDTSDVGPIGGTLELLNISDTQNYQLQNEVVVKGSRRDTFFAQLDQVTIYPNHFQPFGVDWRESLLFLFLALSSVSVFLTIKQKKLEL